MVIFFRMLKSLSCLLLFSFHSLFCEPYLIHVRSSFAPFIKHLFRHDPMVQIRVFSGPFLTLSAQQSHNRARMIIGLDGHKKHLIQQENYIPYVRGYLALIVRSPFTTDFKTLLSLKGTWIGQDPETSSTGIAFYKWAKKNGLSDQEFKGLFKVQTGSLAASFLLFQQGLGSVLVGYTSTPRFESLQKTTSNSALQSIPLTGAYEEWGIVIKSKGKNDPYTQKIYERLFSKEAQQAIHTLLYLELIPKDIE